MNRDQKLSKVLELDKKLRKIIADYYFALNEMGDPTHAVQMLAEHITILVEMLNDLKERNVK